MIPKDYSNMQDDDDHRPTPARKNILSPFSRGNMTQIVLEKDIERGQKAVNFILRFLQFSKKTPSECEMINCS